MKTSNHSRYLVKSLVHASRVLEAFQSAGDVLRLRDVVTRTGFQQGHVFPAALHAASVRISWIKSARITTGWRAKCAGAGCTGSATPRRGRTPRSTARCASGLVRAAEREHVELIVVDNRYQPKIALRSADYLIKEQVDLVIEFQTDEVIAPAIASKYLEANIPFIAIDIPHPGATYFGANNYQAGLMAGHYLGRWAKKHWDSEPDEILMVELHRAGSLPKARIRGIQTGIAEIIRVPERCRISQRGWRRPIPDHAGAGAQTSAGIEGKACAGRRCERLERAGRAARV